LRDSAFSPEVSIIIPAYNEALRIRAALDGVLEWLQTHPRRAEVIVVNDGSQDRTRDIVLEYASRGHCVRLMENAHNCGKGCSVRNGILDAQGEVVLFTDADLSAPMEEAELLIGAIEAGADCAIGSRWLDRSRQTIHQPLYRQLFGRMFNGVTRVVMGLPFADTQCGFKAFRREAAHQIFSRQTIMRWGFDPEILFIALRMGYRVQEVPVTWGHDERSRMSYLRDGLTMLEEIARVRWNSLTGAYNIPGARSAVAGESK
jgi:glycosyltransferase involved in cell wall biosynthesis